jgi:hypothetical protein
MNNSTDKQNHGSRENSVGCSCDYTLAFLLLRGWLAVRAIFRASKNSAPTKASSSRCLTRTASPTRAARWWM